MTVKFEIGKIYSTRSTCDYNCIYEFKILSRTKLCVWIEVYGQLVRRKITIWDKREEFFPFGHYSMCPCIRA